MTDGITPEQAILVAKAAGLDTTDLERQASDPDPIERAPEAPPAPAQPEPTKSPELLMAEGLREHLNASLTPWHSL
jgi:hypothetical protein